jgi:hypothetical protein
MTSYASIASKPPSSIAAAPEVTGKKDLKQEIQEWLTLVTTVKTAPDSLSRCVEILRREMEPAAVNFRGMPIDAGGGGSSTQPSHGGGGQPTRNFGGATRQSGWRSGTSTNRPFSGAAHPFESRSDGRQQTMPRNTSSSTLGSSTPVSTPRPVARYQSKFKSVGNIEDKILNTVIGNKLNAFTPLTYDDTRDFIYQIMDSGETEFVRDFVEKVFTKATLEDLYCGLFAKLIAEIAHRYPVMYEEMNKYHGEFMKIFENVQEERDVDYVVLVKQKQYRMGYGQFMAELAGQNALEKDQLLMMVRLVMESIWLHSSDENKVKAVEEFIDCFIRLGTSLRDRCPVFFKSVKEEMWGIVGERVQSLIAREGAPRPSLSSKGRFGLMDLRDLLK